MCAAAPSQNEMKKLEAMRLEVDSRRRTVVDLDRQLATQKMKTMKRAEVWGGLSEDTAATDAEEAFLVRPSGLRSQPLRVLGLVLIFTSR